MGKLLNIITPLHKRTKRDYLKRMMDEKVTCSKIARRYGEEYWDGDRRFGYGGYKYDGRWELVAHKLIEHYQLPKDARILDVGCGKGFLLYELQKILPDARVTGFDISAYGIKNAKTEINSKLFVHKAEVPYPFKDKEYDLVISVTTLHNLYLNELKTAFNEIERVARHGYVAVESFRNEEELFNLQCWALTCNLFFTPQDWIFLFNEFGYSGDYEFIYFE